MPTTATEDRASPTAIAAAAECTGTLTAGHTGNTSTAGNTLTASNQPHPIDPTTVPADKAPKQPTDKSPVAEPSHTATAAAAMASKPKTAAEGGTPKQPTEESPAAKPSHIAPAGAMATPKPVTVATDHKGTTSTAHTTIMAELQPIDSTDPPTNTGAEMSDLTESPDVIKERLLAMVTGVLNPIHKKALLFIIQNSDIADNSALGKVQVSCVYAFTEHLYSYMSLNI